MKCQVCDCEDLAACWDDEFGVPCHWITEDLCSVCAREQGGEIAGGIQKHIGMLMSSVEQCLAESWTPVLVVLRKDGAFKVNSTLGQEGLRTFLLRLIESLPDMPLADADNKVEPIIIVGNLGGDREPFGKN